MINCKYEAILSKTFIHSSIKPPDLLVVKEDFSHYEKKIKRWSKFCGISPDQQGDVILIHPSLTNPSLIATWDKLR